ncbi:hypothetical protein RHMOL_Rhmol01G0159700 [Rhododendron molle]|uniref:Uncharacterized protein n=1 Tax=Rhododendron molle TaxID=49168 RepID=A0ACC0Q1N4_RHOML|nr:hypothetical protein RHMOL_Rhmol01G0159700 [Rhododendron molle]
MAPKIAQPYLKIPIGNSISGGIAPNRFVRNGSKFLKWGELVLAANGSIYRVPIVKESKLHSELLHWFWQRIKAILTRFHRFVSLSDLSTIPSSSTNFQVLFFFLRSVAFDFFFLFWNFCLRS